MARPAETEPAQAEALALLIERYGLAAAQREQLRALLDALAEPTAPTTVRAGARAVEVHLADSLVALELEQVRAAAAIADLGSGAGFPGLALAVALPNAQVDLVESQTRKCAFIEAAIDRARIANARAIRSRAEEFTAGAGAYELVTARALAPQPVVLEYAAPLLCHGGALVDWRAGRSAEQEQAALRAARELGLEWVELRPVTPYAGARELHLHVFAKSAATPPRFPRRAGIARKRPLGG